jgi:hypothetical protein
VGSRTIGADTGRVTNTSGEHPPRPPAVGVAGDEGPFIVESVADLCRLMGPGCTTGDAGTLWRLLREEGCLRLEETRAVIELRTLADLRARCRRAQVAARRERSAFATFDWL